MNKDLDGISSGYIDNTVNIHTNPIASDSSSSPKTMIAI